VENTKRPFPRLRDTGEVRPTDVSTRVTPSKIDKDWTDELLEPLPAIRTTARCGVHGVVRLIAVFLSRWGFIAARELNSGASVDRKDIRADVLATWSAANSLVELYFDRLAILKGKG